MIYVSPLNLHKAHGVLRTYTCALVHVCHSLAGAGVSMALCYYWCLLQTKVTGTKQLSMLEL